MWWLNKNENVSTCGICKLIDIISHSGYIGQALFKDKGLFLNKIEWLFDTKTYRRVTFWSLFYFPLKIARNNSKLKTEVHFLKNKSRLRRFFSEFCPFKNSCAFCWSICESVIKLKLTSLVLTGDSFVNNNWLLKVVFPFAQCQDGN